jgi:PCFT/HCP family folate transporter-like MFS transporter 1/3
MDEQRPLLINEKIENTEVDDAVDTEQEITSIPEPTVVIPKRRTIVVEPVMLLFCLGILGNDPLLEQYTHSRMKHLYPVLHNGTGDANNSKCAGSNGSDPFVIEENEVTSVWQTYYTLPCLFSIFTSLLYGAYSDVVGRRPILLLPSIFGIIKFTINASVIYFNLPLYIFVVSACLETMGGGFYTLSLGVYAYLADSTTAEKLGLRMTVVDGIMGLSIGLSQIGSGFSIRHLGYFYTYLILGGFVLVNLIYAIFFVPETIIRDKNKQFQICGYLKSMWLTFTNTEDQRHVKIGLLILGFLLCNMVLQSQMAIQILYAMGPPLCWGTVNIGLYSGTTVAFLTITGIVGLELFTRCKVHVIGIAAIGITSTMLCCLVNAWTDSWLSMTVGKTFTLNDEIVTNVCRRGWETSTWVIDRIITELSAVN